MLLSKQLMRYLFGDCGGNRRRNGSRARKTARQSTRQKHTPARIPHTQSFRGRKRDRQNDCRPQPLSWEIPHIVRFREVWAERLHVAPGCRTPSGRLSFQGHWLCSRDGLRRGQWVRSQNYIRHGALPELSWLCRCRSRISQAQL